MSPSWSRSAARSTVPLSVTPDATSPPPVTSTPAALTSAFSTVTFPPDRAGRGDHDRRFAERELPAPLDRDEVGDRRGEVEPLDAPRRRRGRASTVALPAARVSPSRSRVARGGHLRQRGEVDLGPDPGRRALDGREAAAAPNRCDGAGQVEPTDRPAAAGRGGRRRRPGRPGPGSADRPGARGRRRGNRPGSGPPWPAQTPPLPGSPPAGRRAGPGRRRRPGGRGAASPGPRPTTTGRRPGRRERPRRPGPATRPASPSVAATSIGRPGTSVAVAASVLATTGSPSSGAGEPERAVPRSPRPPPAPGRPPAAAAPPAGIAAATGTSGFAPRPRASSRSIDPSARRSTSIAAPSTVTLP